MERIHIYFKRGSDLVPVPPMSFRFSPGKSNGANGPVESENRAGAHSAYGSLLLALVGVLAAETSKVTSEHTGYPGIPPRSVL